MYSQDFDVKASWSFFVTSHGKSPCDGIGGTVKRSIAMESLRRPLQNQVSSLDAMILHGEEKQPNIHCVKIPKEDIELAHEKLQNCFKSATTIKRTKGFHFFQPDSQIKNFNEMNQQRHQYFPH